jgi:hypothetical protein
VLRALGVDPDEGDAGYLFLDRRSLHLSHTITFYRKAAISEKFSDPARRRRREGIISDGKVMRKRG